MRHEWSHVHAAACGAADMKLVADVFEAVVGMHVVKKGCDSAALQLCGDCVVRILRANGWPQGA